METGTIINQYTIISAIGKGGMGEVYKARDSRLDREVAIKILPPELAKVKGRMSRFVREAKSASALNHPNIITIHEIGESDGLHFIAMEYIEGVTLHEKIRRDRPGLRKMLGYLQHVARALTKAHSAGIVHRDLKPENIMVTDDGYTKILDFGLAKLMEPDNAPGTRDDAGSEIATAMMQQHSLPGMVLGTVGYMSPEQAQGRIDEIDHRSDIFSFGCILYEAATGQKAFEGKDVLDSLHKIVHAPTPQITDVNPNAPADLQRIVRRCLAKNRDKRYQTIKEVEIEIEEIRNEMKAADEIDSSVSPPTDEVLSSKRGETAGTDSPVSSARRSANSIAVLPFSNISADPDNEYFCDGLAEELLNALAKIDELKVAARTAAFSFRGSNVPISEIGRVLNVTSILEGSVRKLGNRVRITVQLINADDGFNLWSERYDREMQDIFEIQDDITLAVVDALKVKLLGAEKMAVLRRYTENAEAYQLYLRGKFFWNKRTGDDLKRAVEFYNQAIEKDPSYALAFSGLAETYLLFSGFDVAPADDSMPLAKAAALRALDIDESLAEAHVALGYYLTHYEFDLDRSEKEFRRAIEINSKYATAHQWFSVNLAVLKRFDESLAELRLAEELDPLSPDIGTDLGATFVFARRYDEGIAQFKRTLVRDPNFSRAYSYLGWAYGAKGMYAEAIANARTALKLNNSFFIKGYLALWLAKSGNRDEALAILAELKKAAVEGYVRPSTLAVVYVGLEDKVEALNQLEKELSSRSFNAIYIGILPELDDLRSEPRFRAMLRQLNLPD